MSSSLVSSFARLNISKKPSTTTNTSSSVSKELLLYIQKLRTDDPKKNTAYRLSKRFNIPVSVITKEAPPFELKEKMRNDLIRKRRESKVKEDPKVKAERLEKWRQQQIENSELYRKLKHEYVLRRNKVINEVDEDIWKQSDLRDEKADIAAEKIRSEKRRAFGMKKKK